MTIEDQVADVFTKSLLRMKFEYFRDKLLQMLSQGSGCHDDML